MAAQTSSRKQWRLYRGPKGDVQSLGWAEFGCPESQVKLAKELLEDSGEDTLDKEGKCRLGVYWLLKASEKGHEEATQMLEECLENGIGISEHNLSDVKSCLALPKGEKLSREAARELFLSLSQGDNYITSGQLFRETLKYSEGPYSSEIKSDISWKSDREMVGERLTEEMLVACGSGHVRGELPPALSNLNPPGVPLACQVSSLATLPLIPPPAYLLLAISFFGGNVIIDVAPYVIYYVSLVIMILSTSRILSKKWEFNQFQRWSYTLVACGCSEEVSAQAQWTHCIQNTHPFLIFISSLLVNLIFSSYISHVPFSEIATLSTLISLYVLINVMFTKKKIDFLILFTFVIHLLARYPYEIDEFVYHYWRYLDVHTPNLTSLVLGSSIEFCLNFRVILYLMLPGFFVKIAARGRWIGLHSTLLPFFVCLSWWQMALSASNGATYFGVIRSCLGFVLIILFLPLQSICLIVPVFATVQLFVTEQIPLHLTVGSITFLSALYILNKYKKWRVFFYIKAILCILSVFLLINWGGKEPMEQGVLGWKAVAETCGKEDIASQERCIHFVGRPVSWEGRVANAKLSSVHNPLQPIVQLLPTGLEKLALCLLGENLKDCNDNEDCDDSLNRCCISNWNRYKYEIHVELFEEGWTTNSFARLIGGQEFRNFSLSISPGDMIWFAGTLEGYHSKKIQVSLVEAKCTSCSSTHELPVEVSKTQFIHSFISRVHSFISIS